MENNVSASDLLKIYTERQKKIDAVQEYLMRYIKPISTSLESMWKVQNEQLEVTKKILTAIEALLEKSSEEVRNLENRSTLSSLENASNDVTCDSPQQLSPQPPRRKVRRSAVRRPPPQGKCLGCHKIHQFADCDVYVDWSSRIKVLKEKGLCMYCTNLKTICSPGNQKCEFKTRKCQHCRLPHNNALCPTAHPQKSKTGDA